MQASCLSVAGRPDVETPNIDRLAEKGIRFERAYCENPICTPSRLSMLTGLSSRQHGVYGNGRLVPHTMKTMVSVLKDSGYRTHASGKLHLQPWDIEKYRRKRNGERVPGLFSYEDDILWREGGITDLPTGYFGFETSDYVRGHGDYVGGNYIQWLKKEHSEWAVPREDMYRPKWRKEFPSDIGHPGGIASCYRMTVPEEIHYNTWITDRTIRFLDSHTAGRPFFLWCSFPDPHHPFAACSPYSEMYDPESLTLPSSWQAMVDESSGLNALPHTMHGFRMENFNEAGLRHMLAQTYGMISHIDRCIGRVMEALERSDNAEKTVVVFIADHGEYLGAHHLMTKGDFPFEELMRVPLIWSDPDSPSHGETENGIVSLLDIAPTVLERAGVPLECLNPEQHYFGPAPPWFQGGSLCGRILHGGRLADRCFLASREDHDAQDPDHERYIRVRCLYRGAHKLVVVNDPAVHALYDLACDPHELHDRWHDPAYGEIRAEMLETYRLFALDTEYGGRGRTATA
jgi:arylsulfatase A-like enzyme